MDVRYVADPIRFQRMNTQEIRASFLAVSYTHLTLPTILRV